LRSIIEFDESSVEFIGRIGPFRVKISPGDATIGEKEVICGV